MSISIKSFWFFLACLFSLTTKAQESYYKGGKYGLKDNVGNILIKPKYEFIGNFVNGLGKVELMDKFGLINGKGVEVVAPKYDHIGDFVEGLALIQLDEKYGFINLSGKEVVTPKYDVINDFKPLLLGGKKYFCVELDEKWGLIDSLGIEVVVPKYRYPLEFEFEGLSQIAIIDPDDKIYGNSVFGLMDMSFKEVLSPKYHSIVFANYDYIYVTWGAVGVKVGLLNISFNEIIPLKYDHIEILSNDVIAAASNDKWILFDSEGLKIGNFEYEELYNYQNNNLAKVRRGGKYGFIDETGQEVIACKFDEAAKFIDERAMVKLEGKEYYIDKNGMEKK